MTAVLAVAASAAALALPSTQAVAAAPSIDTGSAPGVLANLWEWNWNSVANECETVLGPAGYAGVQVAPPADSLSRDYTTSDAPILHPWWEVYQPVDYKLFSRFGTPAQFHDMVDRCRAAGVKVYVDAVINHMTGQGHKSYRGVEYTHFHYGGLYGYRDFHHKGNQTTGPNECPSASGGIDDFNNYTQVTKCELLGLADLRTDYAPTRDKIVAYLNHLLDIGVSGFRVDAAKHIGEDDLISIYSQLEDTVDGTRPFWALEVFPGGPGQLSQLAFTRAGTVLGFDYAYQIKNAFKSYTGDGTGNITGLRVFGEDAGLVPSNKSLVFIENHDTERGNDTLSYRDGATNTIANEFMLAYPYGTPQVYSAFSFDPLANYQSPPADADGFVTDTDCTNGWVCVDRYLGVRNMVGFHNYVANAPLQNWYDDNTNLVAFSRGSRGFFTTNNASTAKTVTVQTGLPGGTYCDLIHGTLSAGHCSGPTVSVAADGTTTITVPAKDSIAFTRKDRSA
jgi:alpha-amylase